MRIFQLCASESRACRFRICSILVQSCIGFLCLSNETLLIDRRRNRWLEYQFSLLPVSLYFETLRFLLAINRLIDKGEDAFCNQDSVKKAFGCQNKPAKFWVVGTWRSRFPTDASMYVKTVCDYATAL